MYPDIEDFTTDALRREILRREIAVREGRCWYCNGNLAAHTCKHAKPSPVPGWTVEPATYLVGENCIENAHDYSRPQAMLAMGHEEQYWRTSATQDETGTVCMGCGDTASEATAKCIESCLAYCATQNSC